MDVTDSKRGAIVAIGRALSGLVSLALGAFAGFLVTLAIVVARARLGSFVHDIGEMVALRWETAPILIGAGLCAWLGFRDPRALVRAMSSGGAGMVIGIGLGAAAGAFLSETPEGVWSGMIIGGVAGMTMAAVASVARWYGGLDSAAPGASS